MIANRFNPLGRKPIYSAKSYLQTSLLSHFDGIENVGYGVDDRSATTWVDLKGVLNRPRLMAPYGINNNDIVFGENFANPSASFTSWVGTQKAGAYAWQDDALQTLLASGVDFTVECACKLTAGGGNGYSNAISFNSTNGYATGFPFRYYSGYGNGGERIGASYPATQQGTFAVIRKNGEYHLAVNGVIYDVADFSFIKTDALWSSQYGWIILGPSTGAAYNNYNDIDVYGFRIYQSALEERDLSLNHFIDKERFGIVI